MNNYGYHTIPGKYSVKIIYPGLREAEYVSYLGLFEAFG